MPAAQYLEQVVHPVLGLAKTAALLLVRPDGHLAFCGCKPLNYPERTLVTVGSWPT
jgi:hypothetical protein